MSTKNNGDRKWEPPLAETSAPGWLKLVRHQVDSLKYGAVQITIHDSHVTQVERLEKVRLDHSK